MKKSLPAWAVLCIIALAAGLMLGATNELTAERIIEQAKIAADAARSGVLPAATEFVEQELPEGAAVDNCYAGMAGGEVVGYTAQSTVKGYGGEIEVVVGITLDGVISGVNVGGAGFSETAGLGAKTKDAKFVQQFQGAQPPVYTGEQDIVAVTAATISSNAVISGINQGAEYIVSLLGGGEEEGAGEGAISTNLTEQPLAEGIDAWWKADEGYIVQTSARGYGGMVTAKVGIYLDGTIASVEFEAPAETIGIGSQIVDRASFAESFIGQSVPLDVDTISSATFSSTAAIEAVEAALDFVGGL